MKRFLLAAALMLGTAASASAQNYPAPIVSGLTFGPGGPTITGAGKGQQQLLRGSDLADTVGPSVLAQSGADPLGSADSSGAMSAAAAVGAPAFFVPPGLYKLNSTVVPAVGQTVELGAVKFTGPGVIAGIADWSPLQTQISHGWIRTTAYPGNDFGIVSSLAVNATGGTSSYEKAAGYFSTVTGDQSTTAYSKDAVGILSSASLGQANQNGHIFGGNSYANFNCFPNSSGVCTSDGTGDSWEFDTFNYSSNQTDLGSPFAKQGIGVVAGGTVPSTTGIRITAQSQAANWNHGIDIDQSAINLTAIRIIKAGTTNTSVYSLDVNGNEVVTNLAVTAGLQVSTGAYQANGTTQATAQQLPSDYSLFTAVAAGGEAQLRASLGVRQQIVNRGANALLVLPFNGATIDGATSVSVPVSGDQAFICWTTTLCSTIK